MDNIKSGPDFDHSQSCIISVQECSLPIGHPFNNFGPVLGSHGTIISLMSY